jgi:hypothetical protein
MNKQRRNDEITAGAGPPLYVFFVKVGTTRSAVTAFLWEYVAVKQLRSYAFEEEGAVRIDQWG